MPTEHLIEVRQSLHTRDKLHTQLPTKLVESANFLLRIPSAHVAEIWFAVYFVGIFRVQLHTVVAEFGKYCNKILQFVDRHHCIARAVYHYAQRHSDFSLILPIFYCFVSKNSIRIYFLLTIHIASPAAKSTRILPLNSIVVPSCNVAT